MKKTAFVTGGTGFLGTNLIEELVSEGWEVTALHRPTSNLYLPHRGLQNQFWGFDDLKVCIYQRF